MNIYEITTRCLNCGEEVKAIVSEHSLSPSCTKCNSPSAIAKKFKGAIYVMTNNRHNFVKVGLTEKSPRARARRLSNDTGAVGKYTVCAIFPSKNPKRDEQKAHHKLRKYHAEKEFFEYPPAEIIAKVRTALGKDPIILDSTLREEVSAIVEQNRLAIQKKLSSVQI